MFNLVLANFAVAFTILLSILGSFLFESVHWWFTPLGFCSVFLFLFTLLLLTLDKQTLDLHKSIHYVFGIANILSFAGFALFIIGAQEGANPIGAFMFAAIYFYIPALVLFLCGIIALVANFAHKAMSNHNNAL